MTGIIIEFIITVFSKKLKIIDINIINEYCALVNIAKSNTLKHNGLPYRYNGCILTKPNNTIKSEICANVKRIIDRCICP